MEIHIEDCCGADVTLRKKGIESNHKPVKCAKSLAMIGERVMEAACKGARDAFGKGRPCGGKHTTIGQEHTGKQLGRPWEFLRFSEFSRRPCLDRHNIFGSVNAKEITLGERPRSQDLNFRPLSQSIRNHLEFLHRHHMISDGRRETGIVE
jgi:hypothetical protein